MSGGTFDYVQYRINDAIAEIEQRLHRNGKTVLELWNEKSEDEKECAAEYERPWDLLHHPYWVDEEAAEKADQALGAEMVEIKPWGRKEKRWKGKPFEKLSKADKEIWNQLRQEAIEQMIDENNNSNYLGSTYSDETVAKIREILVTIKKAKIFLDRLDWLFAGDDGEEEFFKRIDEDLKEEGLAP